MRVITDLCEIPAQQWNRLASLSAGRGPDEAPQPFLDHAFLSALEETGCVGPGTGWKPQHLVLFDSAGALVGAVPLYEKRHSYGEYVFDWAWADAYQRHGLRYYPKWLCAIPFSPVPGARILAIDTATAELLCNTLVEMTRQSKVSSLHVLFPPPEQAQLLQSAGMMLRQGVQFHWMNLGFADFDAFLASLTQPKRKKIRAERRKVAQAGVRMRRLAGTAITARHWAFFYRCYANTYAEHGSTPYLSEAFFLLLAQRLPDAFVMVLAERAGRPIAASLLMRDTDRLYGRYWGALERVDCLHFETAFYQAIEAAIELQLPVVEGGAQGEHKMARGFLPVKTQSAHWLAEPAFAQAVEQFLTREGQAIGGYLDELAERVPFRSEVCVPPTDIA